MKRILKPREVIYNFNAGNGKKNRNGEFGLPQYEEVYKRINTALNLKCDGYNLYLVDEFCKSRIKHIVSYVKYILKDQEPPKDICYVVKNEEKIPVPIFVKNGYGNILKNKIQQLKEEYNEIAYEFYNKDKDEEKDELVAAIKNRRSKIIEELISQSKEFGFDIKMTDGGFSFVPLLEGKEMTEEEYEELDENQRSKIMDRVDDLKSSASEILDRLRNMQYDELERLKEIMKSYFEVELEAVYNGIEKEIGDDEEAINYINYIMEDIEDKIVENYSINYEDDEDIIKAIIMKYDINVIVDNSNLTCPPVIYEENPSTSNLLGNIEYENHNNVYVSTVKSIKAGSYVRANGGCIIINANSLFSNPQAYNFLKKSLISERVSLDHNSGYIELFTLGGLKPAEMSINTKVILIGDFYIYDTLYNYDSEFKSIFKLRAEYKGVLKVEPQVKNTLIMEIKKFIKEEALMPIDKSGLKEISKYLARQAEDRKKVLFDHCHISNILTLANYKAKQENKSEIDGEIVEAVINEKDLLEENYDELYDEGKILINVQGEEIGQINALSVIDMGYITFGKPMRITCTCFAGDGRIIDSQRESNLSGKIHTKAMSILRGYMGNLNGGYSKLPVDFNLSFEQVYGMVDGDSASVAEVLVMVSALCKLPIKQNIALTGSINQFGIVQPIGGVNEKIEGFFKVCKMLDTVEDKIVIIPASNARNLILSSEVEEAVLRGAFKIYTMETVEDAMEVAFGKKKVTRESIGKLIEAECEKYKNGDKVKIKVKKKPGTNNGKKSSIIGSEKVSGDTIEKKRREEGEKL